MKTNRFAFKIIIVIISLCALSQIAAYAQTEGLVCDENGCPAVIAATKYDGREAWQMSDGKTVAVIVPSLGRVMSFKRIDGPEWLWDGKRETGKAPNFGAWKNWGGDKTWLAPQSDWLKWLGKKWPPDPTWDTKPFSYEVLTGGKLKLIGKVSAATGIRLTRTFWHDVNGDFVIEQTAEKVSGKPLDAGIWSVTQIAGESIDAVFLPRSPKSDYPNGFAAMGGQPNFDLSINSPKLLALKPVEKGSYKVGSDAPLSAITAVQNGWAFTISGAHPAGDYPDGKSDKAGTPTQLFAKNDGKSNYLEMEVLGPLRPFHVGTRWTHTVRWHLEKLSDGPLESSKVLAAIDAMLSR